METIYDLIGIGIGPFNLGLAALADSIPELKCLFIDKAATFNWHPGLLMDNARLQVPFYADLVTLEFPQSPYSFFCFLKAKKRMIRFASNENYFPLRKEYNEYCRWVAGQLPDLRFGHNCEAIHYDEAKDCYQIKTNREVFRARHIVIGTGTVPAIPDCAKGITHPLVLHSGEYLFHKKDLLEQKSVSVIGSGQSAAEIFYDLLQHTDKFKQELNWFTRSPRFFPMEYTALTLEMTSPDYIQYYYNLSPDKKKHILLSQDSLYKGINASLINEIYNTLYARQFDQAAGPVGLISHSELVTMQQKGPDLELQFYHREQEQSFLHETAAVILATGYQYKRPEFLQYVKELIETEDGSVGVKDNYSIDSKNSIFIQNAGLLAHGFNTPDLGMGPYRNAVILNTILGYEHFQVETGTSFQTFGI